MVEHVRFMEIQRYDPMIDCEVVDLRAITDKGTFHSEVRVDGPVTLRSRRAAFKEHVLTALEAGESPREITL